MCMNMQGKEKRYMQPDKEVDQGTLNVNIGKEK